MGRIAGVTPEQTRARLVDAAASIVELEGYEGATVSRIAEQAGVTTGAIYAHYGSKAELLVDAIRVHGDRAAATALPPGGPTDAAGLLLALGARLDTDERPDAALLTEAVLATRRDPELREVLAAALGDREQLLAGVLADGQARGDIADDVSAEVAARFAMMLGLGSMIVRTLDLPATDPDEWTAFIGRLVDAFVDDPST